MKDFIMTAIPFVIVGIAIVIIATNYKKNPKNTNSMSEGMCIGMCLGITIALSLDINLGLGISLGMLVGDTSINQKYLLRYMLSDAFNLQVATAMSSRVKMPKINQNELSKILIPIPPMPEQERIVNKIEELFDKITLN